MSDKKEIEPDMPQMRSVMIGAAPTPMIPPPMPLRTSKAQLQKAQVVPSGSTSSTSWTINKVTELPSYYPLERYHDFIEEHEPQDVAERISESLRTVSAAATYAECSASVETTCGTKFEVNLFKQGDRLVVECQRVYGCSFTFCQSAKAVLRAAKGEKPLPRMKTPAIPAIPQHATISEDNVEDEALEIAKGLLQEERHDAKILGMQSLVQLSSCGNSSLDKALASTVLGHVQAGCHDSQSSHEPQLHRLALHVFANVLCSNNIDLSLISDEILMSLVSDLSSSEIRPHNAYQAARCLVSVCRSGGMKERLAQLGFSGAVSHAYDRGVSTHALLEQEAKLLEAAMRG